MYIFDTFSGRYFFKSDSEIDSIIQSAVSKDAVVYLWPTVKLVDPNPDKTIEEILEILDLPKIQVAMEFGKPRKIEIYVDQIMIIDDEKRNLLVIDTEF